jgi:catabolite regulation protein CreA
MKGPHRVWVIQRRPHHRNQGAREWCPSPNHDRTNRDETALLGSANTAIFFKHTHVFRIVDKKRNTLVYVALSDKIIEGSPQNSLSTVPVMPWGKW